MPTSNETPQTRSDFIRTQPIDRPVLEVVNAAKAAGFAVKAGLVYEVRRMMRAHAGEPPKRGARKQAAAVKPRTTSPAKTTSASRVKATNKTAFVRALADTASTEEILTRAKAAGFAATKELVFKVRSEMNAKRRNEKGAPLPAKAAIKTASGSSFASKRDFVRAHGRLSPQEVTVLAAQQGIKMDIKYVYNARAYDAARASSGAKPAAPKPVVAKAVAPAPSPAPTVVARATGSGGSTLEDLLRAVAAELGLRRAVEMLEAERARVKALLQT
jgi:hypothetical protein